MVNDKLFFVGLLFNGKVEIDCIILPDQVWHMKENNCDFSLWWNPEKESIDTPMRSFFYFIKGRVWKII